ncbi:hypothetical protein LTR10_021405 [Elasticomyces elasticus]|nr:hypothetical protein LTR10_021405 [Elasticomyces elasticus]KAK4971794.1 hypothetical protein LTR42_007522 [Elasticomyces elasticus]
MEEIADLMEKPAALKLAVDNLDDLNAYNILVTGIEPGRLTLSHMPALHRMAEMMQPQTVRMLLDLGADLGVAIDEADGEGRTALVYALEQNRYDVANLLMERGARLDIPDKKGSTALHHAVSGVVRSHHADQAVTRLLAAPNALVSTQNQAGYTPLHICAQSCTPSACHYAERMLDRDSTILDLKTQNGDSPLQLVIRKYTDPDTTNKYQTAPMYQLLVLYGIVTTTSSGFREGVDAPQGTDLAFEMENLDRPEQPPSLGDVKSSMRASLSVVGTESDIWMGSAATLSGFWIQSFVKVLVSNEDFILLIKDTMND